MDAVRDWLGNGAKNRERFFLEDNGQSSDSCILSVGGIFHFRISFSSPFTISLANESSSRVLGKFITKANKTSHNSVGSALDTATEAYASIADELDEELANDDDDEDTEVEEDDAFDVANREAIQAAKDSRLAAQIEMEAHFLKIRQDFDIEGMNKASVERILSDYSRVHGHSHFGWNASPMGRNLQKWTITLFNFEGDLKKDMERVKARTGKDTIDMEMTFPANYPYDPPFLRVVRPRFQLRTGRVTIGGSICTQLLTSEGWKPIYDVESIIESIRQQITDEKSGARIDHDNRSDYTLQEAQEAFTRVAAYHKEKGWDDN